MKKFFTLIAAVACAFSAMATTFNFSSSTASQTIDGITVTLSKANGSNEPAVYSDHVRLYAGNTITISGGNLTNASLSFTKQGSKAYAELSASTGKLMSGGESTSNDDVKTDTWTGNTSSVTFTLGATGQRIITRIVVNGDGSEPDPSDPSEPSEPDVPGSLDPDYLYAEPTIVNVPAKTVQGEAYTFISNNIEVSCTKGAISDTYFSAHAGFDMTFTATQRIKGIVINGFVKKDFTATCDHGTISYLTPGQDREANPVVVITDVNSKTVTISCVKQLRCYTVEVYFEENPEATVEGGSAGSDKDFVFDSADAVYESEFSQYVGPNYSIFLYNASSPEYPYISLDIYPATQDDITGTYSVEDYTLGDYTYYAWGEGDYDAAWALSGTVTITKNANGLYDIKGQFLGDDYVTYNFSYTGTPYFYTDDEYYYGDSGVENIETETKALDPNAPMYDLNGHKVNKDYKGIIIQKGRKVIVR